MVEPHEGKEASECQTTQTVAPKLGRVGCGVLELSGALLSAPHRLTLVSSCGGRSACLWCSPCFRPLVLQ